jgi:hypothetical protein
LPSGARTPSLFDILTGLVSRLWGLDEEDLSWLGSTSTHLAVHSMVYGQNIKPRWRCLKRLAMGNGGDF